jgi:hypothetical protein
VASPGPSSVGGSGRLIGCAEAGVIADSSRLSSSPHIGTCDAHHNECGLDVAAIIKVRFDVMAITIRSISDRWVCANADFFVRA